MYITYYLGLYIVLEGLVQISRRITPINVMKENFLPSMYNNKAPDFKITVDETNLELGCIFGDECLRKGYGNASMISNAARDIH